MRIYYYTVFFALVMALPAMGQEDPGGGGGGGGGAPEDQAVTISGFVDARYLSASEDASVLPILPAFGTDASTFQMAEAEVDIAGVIQGVEYRLDIQAFGEAGGPSLFQNIEQAFVRFHFPVQGYNLHLTAGQFNAPMGYERLDAPDLEMITHSFLHAAFLPKTLTGVMVGVDLQENLTAQVSLTNPWDRAIDDVSEGSTVGLHLKGRATNAINWGASAMFGREEPGSDEERLALDGWVRFNIAQHGAGLVKKLYVLVEGTLGEQTQTVRPPGGGPGLRPAAGDHDWLGIRAQLHVQFGGSAFLDRLGLTARVEQISVEFPAGPGDHVLTDDLIDDGTDQGDVTVIAVAAQYRISDNLRFSVEVLNASGDLVLGGGVDDFRQIAVQLLATFPAAK